jgi:hypothetical protein
MHRRSAEAGWHAATQRNSRVFRDRMNLWGVVRNSLANDNCVFLSAAADIA